MIQLKNENILLLCLNEIKIIKLNSLNSYSIIQILTNNQIIDIFEIKDLKLISISKDKKFIIWDLNEQNKYYSLKIINIDNNINEGRLKLINDDKFILLNESYINFYKINDNNIELISLNKSNNRIIDIIILKDLILCFEEEKKENNEFYYEISIFNINNLLKSTISFDFLNEKYYKICNTIKLPNDNLLFGYIDFETKNDCYICECKLINNEWFFLNENLFELKYDNILFSHIEINGIKNIITFGKKQINNEKKDEILIW